MPSFTFNHALADRIADSINGSPKTARDIAKELHEDKHLINQHLYKMQDLIRSDDKVPVWSLPDSDDDEEEEEEEEEEDEEDEEDEDVHRVVYNGELLGFSRDGVVGIYPRHLLPTLAEWRAASMERRGFYMGLPS